MASVRWVNIDKYAYPYSDDSKTARTDVRVILFSRVDIQKSDGTMETLAEWTVEECDVGHFLLNFKPITVGLGNILKCYIEVGGKEYIVAVIHLDTTAVNNYYYSIRIEYPRLENHIYQVRLKSVSDGDTLQDQLFVFDSPRHSDDAAIVDPETQVNVFDSNGDIWNISRITGILHLFTEEITENSNSAIIDDYYEFIGD